MSSHKTTTSKFSFEKVPDYGVSRVQNAMAAAFKSGELLKSRKQRKQVTRKTNASNKGAHHQGPAKLAKHLGDVQTAVRAGVLRADEILQQIRRSKQLSESKTQQPTMKLDAKDCVTIIMPPDSKDIMILQQSLAFLKSEMRSLAQGVTFHENLTDAPQQVTNTAGGLIGSVAYWNDFQSNAMFSTWVTLFDNCRLDEVTLWINGAAIVSTTTGTNLCAIWCASDIDETGTTAFGGSTPTIATIVKYPLHGKGSKLHEPVVPTPNGSTKLTRFSTHSREMPPGVLGNTSTVTRVRMGTWINANGSAMVVSGCHKFAYDVTGYPSSCVIVVARTYGVTFAFVAA